MKTDLHIYGAGVLFGGGKGKNELIKNLSESSFEARSREDYSVPEEILGSIEEEKLRRADRFCRIAWLPAGEAFRELFSAGKGEPEDTGIILSTGFGPHSSTFGFLDDVLDFGEKLVSPTKFSHSLHNSAAGYISSVLDVTGPVSTVTQFFHSFHYALIQADIWLKENRCRYVLVGGVDETGDVMDYAVERKRNSGCNIDPFSFSKNPAAVPGEGSVFLLVGRDHREEGYCRISEVNIGSVDLSKKNAPLVLDTDGLIGDENDYLNYINGQNNTVAAYSPLYGSLMTGSAFSTAIGAFSLKNKTLFGSPVGNSDSDKLDIVSQNRKLSGNTVRSLRLNCSGTAGLITLETIS